MAEEPDENAVSNLPIAPVIDDEARSKRIASLQKREERRADRDARDKEEEANIIIDRPRIYLMEGLGDDVTKTSDGYGHFVGRLMEMYYVRQVKFEEALCRFTTLQSLAEHYRSLLLRDIEDTMDEDTNNKIVLMGYAYGAVIAHRMACLFEEAGTEVALVILDSEVTWKPPQNYRRLGGYQFLGGDIESALMLCRATGCRHFVEGSVRRMDSKAKEVYDEKAKDEFMMGAFCQQASKGRITKKQEFHDFISQNSRKLKYMNTLISNSKGMSEVFDGCALHLQAVDSTEFQQAWSTNEKYCSQLQYEEVEGTHYNFLEEGKAFGTLETLKRWLARRGFFGLAAWRVVAKMYGTTLIREGRGTVVYFMHDNSEDPFGPSGLAVKYKQLAKTLAPFRVVVLCSDEEVTGAASRMPVGQVYTERIMADMEARDPNTSIVIVCSGHSGAEVGWYVSGRLGLSGYQSKIVILDEDMAKQNENEL